MITDNEADLLAQTFYGGGWQVIKKRFADRANHAINALCQPPEQREGIAKGMSDDALRARIQECQYLLLGFEQEVNVHRMNRQRDELTRQQNGSGMTPEQIPAANP